MESYTNKMSSYSIYYRDTYDTGRTRKIGEATTLEDAFNLRTKKATNIIKKLELDEEDEVAAIEEISKSKDMYAEWNGLFFIIKEKK